MNNKRKLDKMQLMGLSCFFAFVFIGAASSLKQAPEEKEALEKMVEYTINVKDAKEITESGKTFLLVTIEPTTLREKSFLFMGSEAVKTVFEAIQESYTDDMPDTVRVLFQFKEKDGSGNKVYADVLSMDFSVQDIENMQLKNLIGANILNFAFNVHRINVRASHRFIKAYCDDDYGKWATYFCWSAS